MNEKYYTREDFLAWYLDAAMLVPERNNWNEEMWRENPPRFYRFLRLDALAQALGIECPLREFAKGKFIQRPLSRYQAAWDKLGKLCGRPLSDEEITHLNWRFTFSKLLACRLALEQVVKVTSGVLLCDSTTMRAIEATTIIGRNVKPEAKKLDEILWELIAPHNPRFSEQFLVEEYGFPVVSLTDIDGEWI